MSLQSQVQIAVPPEKKTFFDISLTKMQGVLIGMVSGMVFHSHPLNKFHKDQVNPSVLTNLTKWNISSVKFISSAAITCTSGRHTATTNNGA